MKIKDEFIVINENLDYIKVILLENGIYLEILKNGTYNEISEEYFLICKARIDKTL